MILVPTRELAIQIESVFKKMQTGFKVSCCYGGHKREIEENNLKQPPALLIGTPGRLADHIRRGSITTDTIETLVLDEFDKALANATKWAKAKKQELPENSAELIEQIWKEEASLRN